MSLRTASFVFPRFLSSFSAGMAAAVQKSAAMASKSESLRRMRAVRSARALRFSGVITGEMTWVAVASMVMPSTMRLNSRRRMSMRGRSRSRVSGAVWWVGMVSAVMRKSRAVLCSVANPLPERRSVLTSSSAMAALIQALVRPRVRVPSPSFSWNLERS